MGRRYKQNLYERGVEDVEMSFHNIEKTNQSYESLTIVQGGGNIGINFNIEAAFSEYQHTGDYAGVLAESTHAIMQGLENIPSVDTAELTNYEAMKDKLSIEVISADANADLLAKIPHENIEDMAVVYRFVLESNEAGRSSILVTNDMIDRMGRAGVHKIGMGVLIGLEEWRTDVIMMARHLRYLQNKYWRTRYSVNFPRMCPSESGFQPNVVISDRELAQLTMAFRIFDHDVDISYSTRESPRFRDNMMRLGVTSMSAGSQTEPGGYATSPFPTCTAQVPHIPEPLGIQRLFLRHENVSPSVYVTFFSSSSVAPYSLSRAL